jgi:hypothetical protein
MMVSWNYYVVGCAQQEMMCTEARQRGKLMNAATVAAKMWQSASDFPLGDMTLATLLTVCKIL